ncbi:MULTISPECIES: hypothetical protein [unclassified Streptomyces]|uniref:hypothetical protein n=1 Tax=unclassified Streptomyces TaxID=2593676 RepID=UPI000378BAD8|nr:MULTISPECIES: hypothetical protein [unclassified Streptomyces]MYX33119.1 hypothetical protein [Streptomyces sp. SID8377]
MRPVGVRGQHGALPDLLWDDVQDLFDPDLTGALPDVHLPGTMAEDWRAVFDLVRSRGWAWTYLEGGVAGRLPRAAEVLARQEGAETAMPPVSPVPGALAVFRLLSAGEVGFDVDLRELRGRRGMDVLCAFSGPSAAGRVLLLVDPRSGR